MLTSPLLSLNISLALNKKSAQKQKELLTTASRKPLSIANKPQHPKKSNPHENAGY